jgi:response regulator RpfG family c-di-GMP phosphodiesterase
MHREITILYVDDEYFNNFIFEKSFKSKYKVITAISPFEGLEKLEHHKNEIIVVISDMRMPGMNGIEFIQKAKARFDNIAYFILSGFDYDDDIKNALETKLIYKFLRKPFDFEEITNAIEEAIKNLDLC